MKTDCPQPGQSPSSRKNLRLQRNTAELIGRNPLIISEAAVGSVESCGARSPAWFVLSPKLGSGGENTNTHVGFVIEVEEPKDSKECV